jgi:hypothetical protein
VLFQHPGCDLFILVPRVVETALVAAPGVEAPIHPTALACGVGDDGGAVSRAQQSSLFISTRVTWAGMMARACSINWAGTPIKTGVAPPMASATLAKVAWAKRPASRQLSGRNGQIIQTACW